MLAFFKGRTLGGSALALLAVLFVALTILVGYGLRGLRADLTANGLYTIAPGTRNILKKLDEPVNLYFFYSRAAGEQAPYLKVYATRVRELLEELSARAKGKIRLQIIDPQPFSAEEDRAAEFGLSPLPFGSGGEPLYFGLAGTNSTDGRAVIEMFHPEKEQFLEYDIAKLIAGLNQPKKPVIGLLTSLPMNADFDQATGQMTDPWVILSQLQELFTVRMLGPDLSAIDPEVQVLVLVHPKDLLPGALFAIDQFVLRGGRALIFVDPLAEADHSGQDQSNPIAAMRADRSSTLEPLLTAWGVEFKPREIIADLEHALTVGIRRGEAPVRHIAILGFERDSLNSKDVITAALDNINVAMAGGFRPRKNSGISFEPLIESSTQAGPLPVERFAMLNDPATLREGFRPSGERYAIAVRVSGKLKTAFPAGKPAGGAPAAAPAAPAPAALKESAQPTNIVLVADSDLLSDLLWVRSQSFFGQRVAQAFASNGDFVFNAIDNLTGSSDLISIRGRASFVRPFERVETIRRQAEDRFRNKERELEDQLKGTEQKLAELQSRRNDQSSMILTPDQEKELERFQEEKLRIRKELREVRHGLDQDIEQLGAVLKIVNIALVPAALSVLALVAVAWRRRRRRVTGT